MSQYPSTPPFDAPQQDHPQATTVLILGICGLAVCGVLGPIAWIMGNRVVTEIDASQGRLGGRENVNVGRVLGMVSSILLGLAVLFLVAMVVLFGVLGPSMTSTTVSP